MPSAQCHVEFIVALLAEGVDRNYTGGTLTEIVKASPSSRRAWIEIQKNL